MYDRNSKTAKRTHCPVCLSERHWGRVRVSGKLYKVIPINLYIIFEGESIGMKPAGTI